MLSLQRRKTSVFSLDSLRFSCERENSLFCLASESRIKRNVGEKLEQNRLWLDTWTDL